MASIVKRGNSVAVVYTYKDITGKRRQKWETVAPEDAEIRKKKIELDRLTDHLVMPQRLTVEDFLYQWISVYAPEH